MLLIVDLNHTLFLVFSETGRLCRKSLLPVNAPSFKDRPLVTVQAYELVTCSSYPCVCSKLKWFAHTLPIIKPLKSICLGVHMVGSSSASKDSGLL